jgi:single-strand DNA-binding protein
MHNTIVAIGHLTADPKSQQTGTGKSICRMRMCISDTNSKNKCFIDVESWEKTAEVCAKYLTKGREVFVEGELCTSSWEGKDGTQQSRNYIKASRVKFLSSGRKNDGDNTSTSNEKNQESSQDEDSSDDVPF